MFTYDQNENPIYRNYDCLATPLACSETKIGPIHEIHLEPGLAQKPHQLSQSVFKLPQSNQRRRYKKISLSRINIKYLDISFYMI